LEVVVRVWRIAVGTLAVVLGVAALALAHDVRAWTTAIDRGDARFSAQPDAARWGAGTWLPGDPALRVTGVADDISVRRGERAFAVAAAAPRGFDNGRRQTQLRALADLELSDTIANGSPSQASRAGNLSGVLAAATETADDPAVGERRAAQTFEAAIRADPSNEDAKHNLELILRRIRVVGSREGAGGSAGFNGDSLTGAGAGLPGSGY
jgi:hypothetical protein